MQSEHTNHIGEGEDVRVERKPFVEKIEIQSSKGKLSAVVHHPDKLSDRLAVLCPGYLDTKDYPNFVALAEELSAQGYTTVRFDFTGTWESEGSMEDYSITQQLEDIKSVINRMVREGDYKKVLLGGHSRGGLVSLLYAARDPRVSAALAIMAPPALVRTANQEKMEAWKRDGFRTSYRDIPGTNDKKEFRVLYSDVEDSRKYNLLADLERIHAPIVLLTGELDRTVLPSDVQRIFDRANEPKKIVMVSGIGHDYRHNPDEIKKVDAEVLRALDEIDKA